MNELKKGYNDFIYKKIMEINELKNSLYKKLATKYKVIPFSQTQWERKCNHCLNYYIVKFADLKRGWGLCCSKTCACIKQWGFSKPWYDIRESEFLQWDIWQD